MDWWFIKLINDQLLYTKNIKKHSTIIHKEGIVTSSTFRSCHNPKIYSINTCKKALWLKLTWSYKTRKNGKFDKKRYAILMTNQSSFADVIVFVLSFIDDLHPVSVWRSLDTQFWHLFRTYYCANIDNYNPICAGTLRHLIHAHYIHWWPNRDPRRGTISPTFRKLSLIKFIN